MSEVWKDVKGYEGLYQVSSEGRIRKYTGRYLHPSYDQDGYLLCTLFKDKGRRMYKVHRIVAEAFIPNPDNLPQINHKNEIKSDNRVENIEWCTSRYNNNYGTKNQRAKSTMITNGHFERTLELARLAWCRPVRCLETGVIYSSAAEVTRLLGLDNSEIGKCCKHKRRITVGGYHWEYVSQGGDAL